MKQIFQFKTLIAGLLLIAIFSPTLTMAAGTFKTVGGSTSFIKVPSFFTTGFAGANNLGEVVIAVIQVFLYAIASLSVLFLIIGGFRYVTSAGNEEVAEKAKKTMTYAVVGFVIVIMSFAAITIIINILLAGQL